MIVSKMKLKRELTCCHYIYLTCFDCSLIKCDEFTAALTWDLSAESHLYSALYSHVENDDSLKSADVLVNFEHVSNNITLSLQIFKLEETAMSAFQVVHNNDHDTLLMLQKCVEHCNCSDFVFSEFFVKWESVNVELLTSID